MLFPTLQTDTAVILATGPSFNDELLEWAYRMKMLWGWALFGINNVYQRVPHLDAMQACNIEWWDTYWNKDENLRKAPFDKWTWHLPTSKKYGIDYCEGIWKDSLSKDPAHIHLGHASGYQILGIAYHYGIRNFYLVGYDMAYPPGKPRHYFGEYPKSLYHNPRTGPNGEFTGLIKCFETIDEADLGIKVWNICPTSSLHHFEKADIINGEFTPLGEPYGPE